MKWRKHSPYLLISDSEPAYKVSKAMIEGGAIYRASINGKFLGLACDTAKEAQDICVNHQSITRVTA